MVAANFQFSYVSSSNFGKGTLPRAPAIAFKPATTNPTLRLTLLGYPTTATSSNFYATNVTLTPLWNGDFSSMAFQYSNLFTGWTGQETPLDLTMPTIDGGYKGIDTSNNNAVVFTGTTSSLSQQLTDLDTTRQYNVSFVSNKECEWQWIKVQCSSPA
ncbi:hypothetical protein B9Z65_8315 [Elsinoe australis]|uniref:Uncharacterized protein n=1 Tax=Elsinoe australis TaxID=40998 RepID=A0A2P7YDE0_9PEZI|nr:hypothetical protein B9Z65_8315 [Elsinoe australis]